MNILKSLKRRLWKKGGVESVLDAGKFDLWDFESAVKAFPQVGEADVRAGAEFCGHPIQDAYLSLYKRQPTLSETPPAGLAPLSDLLGRAMQTPSWQRLKESSTGNMIGAAVGARALLDVIRDLPAEAKDAAQEQARAQAEAQAQEQAADSLLDFAKMCKMQAEVKAEAGESVGAEKLEHRADEMEKEAVEACLAQDEAQAQAQAAQASYQEAMDAQAPQIAQALNLAAGQAQERATEATEFVAGFSLAAGGDPSQIDPMMAQAAAQALEKNQNLKDLAELLGWAKRTVRGEWRKSPRARTNMVGYTIGELRPERMAPVEWAAMLSGDETLETDWLRRVVDGGIRHRKFEGDERQGRGPLVLVRDESGSMNGKPHALAVALEWALLEIARRDNRDFYSIPFSGSGRFHVWQAPRPGSPDPESVLEHLGHFYGGGTEPYGPITKALELIQDGDLRADILVITDGIFGQSPVGFVDRLEAVKADCPIRIETIMINGGRTGPAADWSDRVTVVGDLVADREQLRTAIGGVV